MKNYFKFPNFKNKRKILAITIFVFLYVIALLVSINYAERNGVSWLNPNYTVETTGNRDSGFYTVDISESDEFVSDLNKNVVESNVSTGEIHHLPNVSEFELFLYDALARNGGYLTEDDLRKLKTLHVKVVSQPGAPVDEFYDFLFQDRGEEHLTQKMLLASEGTSQPEDTIGEVQHKTTRKLTYTTHKVKEGQTLWNIARQHGVSIRSILSANQDVLSSDGSNLKVGLILRIPNMTGLFITTSKGDTVSKIATRYNIPKKNILIANNRTSDRLRAGERLFLPGAKQPKVKEQLVKVEIKTRRGKKLQRYVSVSGGTSTKWKGYFAWPLRSKIALSSGFGVRRSPFRRRRGAAFHAGIDLRAPRGTPIHASAPGRVTFSGWRSGYGKTVEITHPNGIRTIYAHCTSLFAHTGESVGMGQVIGSVGTTGRATGSHLHFEVRVNGIPRNPFGYLK